METTKTDRSKTESTIDSTIQWLMQGDPAIRWQTMRDLLDAPREQWQAEQARTAQEGWGAQLLAQQEADGRWGGGLYAPKWISSTYTLLLLRSIGIPRDHPAAQQGAHLVLDGLLGERCDSQFRQNLATCDRCIVGMILSLAVYFKLDFKFDNARVDAIVENLLDEMMADGAWNCRKHSRPRPTHSSFHTTLNVLDGVRDVIEYQTDVEPAKQAALLQAEKNALELLLQHKLFRSDKTDKIINPKFTLFSYPHYWHYDALRGLSYLARANAPRDPRVQEAIALLYQRQGNDGKWPVENRYTGKVFFHMEKIGEPSRWNTLRALRILRWWES